MSCRFSEEVWEGISHTDRCFLSTRLSHAGIRCSLFALLAVVLREEEGRALLERAGSFGALGPRDAMCMLHIGTGNKLGVQTPYNCFLFFNVG